MRKIWLILAIGIFLISITSAVPPVTTTQQFSDGYVIEIPQDNILKVGQNYSFNFHVFNISNGFQKTSGLECNFHLYNEEGNHQYEGRDITSSLDYDYQFNLSSTNFSKNSHPYYYIQCNSSEYGGYASSILVVTENGKDDPKESVIIFFNILFIAIIGGMLSLLLYTIFTFFALDFSAKDLILNISSYFVIFAVYILSQEYLGNKFINDFLLMLVKVGSFTTVILPIIAFIVCFIKSGLELKNQDHY